MIEKLKRVGVVTVKSRGIYNNTQEIVDKINELIEAVNKLNKERKD